MNTKKTIILGFLIFILLAAVVFISSEVWNYMQQKKELKESFYDFSRIIESGNLDGVSLTIYYVSLTTDTYRPLSVDDVIRMCGEKKIIINGNKLKDRIDLLKQISSADLIPVKKSYLNARIYYVFGSEENDKILDVGMWGYEEESIFVNGIAVKEDNVFYETIIPFLPEYVVERLKTFLNWGTQ